MRRFAGIILLLCFVTVGSGLASYLHELQHDREDAIAAKANPGKPAPIHDENNCETHALLHAAALWQGWTPFLIYLGLLVAFLTLIATPLLSRVELARIDCRGPPQGA
ncbi:MAG TPA: hypothetical protein VFE58_12630 [Tepidisphaeraceae bacterium]|jgi:hypothetical protein|nr:hypothetical protein [Tepidisphaeraceae bacterium]